MHIWLICICFFAITNWSTGLTNIINSFVYGLLFVAVTIRTKSIVPSAIAHFAVNYTYLA
ncbi:CPBP family intramembrane metalloprotease [Pseudodesulfovibrio sp. S3]|nr:CPBP family intramembrane metalloprotease [Pseudodesulfovibrio sp. S3]